MAKITLPPRHTLRVKWAPLVYHPMVGAQDCFTVAIVAVAPDGEGVVLTANRLDKLHCLFSDDALPHLQFVRLAIDCLQDEVVKRREQSFLEPMDFGTNIYLGPTNVGSGFNLSTIANSWLSKISVLHETEPQLSMELSSSQAVALEPKKEGRVLPAIREELGYINPVLSRNFNALFKPKDRLTPVRLGYSGEKIVADFDRVPARNIKPTLERIRSKLWLLAEHKFQTKHEQPRAHEMIVIPSMHYDPVAGLQHIKFVEDACSDIEREADTQEIRFRRFGTTDEAARHIYSMESTGQPLHLN